MRTSGWHSRRKEQGIVRPGRQREVKQRSIRIQDTEIDRRAGDMDGANQVQEPVAHGLAARHRRKRADVEVHRNDEISIDEIDARLKAGRLDRLVISPGPCSPAEAGISVPAIRHFAGKLPILGVCLGHQSIGAAFGGRIVRAKALMHGKTSVITTTQEGVFAGLPKQFTVNRYHSLAIERATCPSELQVTAWTEDGEIMGVKHKTLAIEGVQFHPESILTEHGHAMLKNFLNQA